jgi:hypothetical protein
MKTMSRLASVHGLEYEQDLGLRPVFEVRGSDADREDPPEVHGRDLKVSLGGEVWLYGFACPTHGLRYWQVNTEAPSSISPAHPFTVVPGDWDSSGEPECQLCLSPLASHTEFDDPCNEMLVPAESLANLLALAGVLKGAR